MREVHYGCAGLYGFGGTEGPGSWQDENVSVFERGL